LKYYQSREKSRATNCKLVAHQRTKNLMKSPRQKFRGALRMRSLILASLRSLGLGLLAKRPTIYCWLPKAISHSIVIAAWPELWQSSTVVPSGWISG